MSLNFGQIYRFTREFAALEFLKGGFFRLLLIWYFLKFTHNEGIHNILDKFILSPIGPLKVELATLEPLKCPNRYLLALR